MVLYKNPAFYILLASLTAFILLLCTTFSTPLGSTFYFLRTSQASGVKFGMWGWCLDDGTVCSASSFGYTWQPEISVPITKALVFYPISVVFSFFTIVAILPVLFSRSAQGDRVFLFLSWMTFALSSIAFFFMIGVYGVAKSRFEKRGFSANYGNLPWMSLSASLLMLITSVAPYFFGPIPKIHRKNEKSRYGSDWRNRISRFSRHTV
ncbi:hypothetical protein D9619_004486 [Psilocybe cf. subviscida]|uniref:Uncharacterized protein n=1 Tax=Psilocybe cf. subviscida TaxID=2480587 RepID=A0A8H5BPP6_9AGAR|nr:hypothetical protein D9619_004486 [Psilocybe cf. subviscida]